MFPHKLYMTNCLTVLGIITFFYSFVCKFYHLIDVIEQLSNFYLDFPDIDKKSEVRFSLYNRITNHFRLVRVRAEVK